MPQRVLQWIAGAAGAWNISANWQDNTANPQPAAQPPGLGDAVRIDVQGGASLATITGGGFAGALSITGNLALAGAYGFGTVTLGAGGAGGLLAIGGQSSLTATACIAASGSVLASGTLSVTTTLTLGQGQAGLGSAAARVTAAGGLITAAAVVLDAGLASLSTDDTGAIAIGSGAAALPGTLSIAAGATVRGQGSLQAFGAILNNGIIIAQGAPQTGTAAAGTLWLGSVSGTGMLAIGDGATLSLNGPASAGQTLVMGVNSVLALATSRAVPAGLITGFATGDAIDMLGSPITAATYASGTLTLFYGSNIAAQLRLSGTYTNTLFLTAGDGAGGTLILPAPRVTSSGSLSAGTTNPDRYSWSARGTGTTPGSGAWNLAGNWTNLTTGQSPATVAPGRNNLVSITGGQSGFCVIAGPGQAASLSLLGAVAFTGAITTQTLQIGAQATPSDQGTAATLDLIAGATLTATSAAIASGSLAVQGAGAALIISGTLAMGGGLTGIGLPRTALSAGSGGRIQLGGLTLGGGAGNLVTTDPASSIEIGTAGGAALGALTIDAGITVAGNGQLNPFGPVVNNGTLLAQGGVLGVGPTTGAGQLAIGDNATLLLRDITAQPISMTGTACTLRLSSERAAPTGTLTGFGPGDIIDFSQDPISAVAFNGNANGGTLTLSYGGTTVARILLAGSYGNVRFFLTPDATGGTAVQAASSNGTGGTTTQGNTDLLAWANPVSGSWGRPANWANLTTGKSATAAPGSLNAVQITGPSGTAIAVISGPGAAASLSLAGNLAINGIIAASTLNAGAGATLAIGNGSSLAAGSATLAGASLAVSGTGAFTATSATLTAGASLSATARAVVQIATLAMDGDATSLTTDTTGTLEIGTLGGATAGAVTLDAGLSLAASGQINPLGAITDNGTLTALGGTLTLGAVSGGGRLAIGQASQLALNLACTVPIAFTGAGGALSLNPLALPAGVISGFAAGDLILWRGASLSAVSFVAGQGSSPGTLICQVNSESGTSIAGTLLLAGDFSAQGFTLLPGSGGGSVIALNPGGGDQPPPGTATPDAYRFTGAAGTAWANSGNWQNLTTSQSPASVPPGRNNSITLAGSPNGSFTTLAGPGNCATLTLSGQVALGGAITTDWLNADPTTLLLLGGGTTLSANRGTLSGIIAANGGTLSAAAALTLAGSSAAAAVFSTGGGGRITLPGLILQNGALSSGTDGIIEIGPAGLPAASPGLTIDAGGWVSGTGALNLGAALTDNGLITATGGLLTLGDATGAGTLAIGNGGTLLLSSAGAGLTIDFTGDGTLALPTGSTIAAKIDGLDSHDAIRITPPSSGGALPVTASYLPLSGDRGLLILRGGDGSPLGTLTLGGLAPATLFQATPQNDGSLLLSLIPGQNGGDPMTNPYTYTAGPADSFSLIAAQPLYIQPWLQAAIDGRTAYVWLTADGSDLTSPQPNYANIAVLQNATANGYAALAAGYTALIATDTVPVRLFDSGPGNSLLIGNIANDTITGAANDTLVGGSAVQTSFFANAPCTIVGGGDDFIATGQAPCHIITSPYASRVYAGAAANLIDAHGQDTIVATPGIASDDTINAIGKKLNYPPDQGKLTVNALDGADCVVGGSGQTAITGGDQSGGLYFGGSGILAYTGGQGAATVVQGAGPAEITGGPGAITYFGNTGQSDIIGAAGNSIYTVGLGAAAIRAASNNTVFIVAGAAVSVTAAGTGIAIDATRSASANVYTIQSGAEVIYGGRGDERFILTGGNATILPGAGRDTISAASGSATGTITLYQPRPDLTLDLSGYHQSASQILAAATSAGGSLTFHLAGGAEICLAGITSFDPAHILTG